MDNGSNHAPEICFVMIVTNVVENVCKCGKIKINKAIIGILLCSFF